MEKGQIFSLDFLISMAVMMAAIGLVIQTAEVNTYNAKETRVQGELRNVAEITADLIVASNETTCADGRGGHLMNCVDSMANFSKITGFLADAGYGYSVEPAGMIEPVGIQGSNDYYEIRRTVFINNTGGSTVELKVRVWKNA